MYLCNLSAIVYKYSLYIIMFPAQQSSQVKKVPDPGFLPFTCLHSSLATSKGHSQSDYISFI